jgi:hypothetical protein
LTIVGGRQRHLDFDIAVAAYWERDKKTEVALSWTHTVESSLSDDQMAEVRTAGTGMKDELELEPGQSCASSSATTSPASWAALRLR